MRRSTHRHSISGPVEGLTTQQRRLVRRHVKELDIIPRYARFFRDQHQRLLRLVKKFRESSLDVEDNLALFRDDAAVPTQNPWEHVF
jgi:hypothetical protein